MSEQQSRAFIGTSGWKKPMWRGYFYPPGLVQTNELRYASSQLSSLEVNTTFHGLPRASTYRGWFDETPDDFVFAVKGNQAVTHDNLLMNPAGNVAAFFASGVLGLEQKLGPILWQTPPKLAFNPDTVEAFLAVLPHSFGEARDLMARCAPDSVAASADAGGSVPPDRRIRHAFEVRNASFLKPEFTALLRKYNVAAVRTNSPGWPVIEDLTSDFVYARLHGNVDRYPNGYGDTELDEWADYVRAGLRGEGDAARDVFVYFDNPDNMGIRSPLDARKLLERVEPGRTPAESPAAPFPEGPQYLWTEDIFTERFHGSSERGRLLEQNRDRVIALLAEKGITNPRVFGSVARGTDTAESDIDLLVTLPNPISIGTVASLQHQLGELLGCDVDILSDADLGQHLAQIDEEGVPL